MNVDFARIVGHRCCVLNADVGHTPRLAHAESGLRRIRCRTAATDEVPYRAARFESRLKAATAFVGTRQSSDLQGPEHFPKASGTLGCRVLIRVVIMFSHSKFGQPPQWR